jgi:hypothetical protein
MVCQMLLGQPLVSSARAADMEMFGFGDDVASVGWRGRPRVTPRYAMHVQCPWRIVANALVVVGYHDLCEPRSDFPDPDAFGPNEGIGTSRREELLERFYEERRKRPRIVTGCDLGAGGWLRLTFDDEATLALSPDVAAAADPEYWRVFEVGSDAPHIVCRGSGLEFS